MSNEQTEILKSIDKKLSTLIELLSNNTQTPKTEKVIAHMIPSSMIKQVRVNAKEVSAEEILGNPELLQQLTNLYRDYGDLVTHEKAQVLISDKGTYINDAQGNEHRVNIQTINPDSSYIQRVSYLPCSTKYPQGALEVKFKDRNGRRGAIWHYTPTKNCSDWYEHNVCGLMESDYVSQDYHRFIKEEVKYGNLTECRQTQLERVA